MDPRSEGTVRVVLRPWAQETNALLSVGQSLETSLVGSAGGDCQEELTGGSGGKEGDLTKCPSGLGVGKPWSTHDTVVAETGRETDSAADRLSRGKLQGEGDRL